MTPVPSAADTMAAGPASTRQDSSTQGPLEAGAPFGGRYRILRVLGAGGMGVVYQAWDEELGVAVALKVIRPEITSDPYAARDIERRFKRELLLARQVTHKHVVRIHDLGEVDGVKYLTMPFVEGRDLAGLLHEGALPVPRALSFAKQIAAGLEAAHDAGVVHRDLKPENIMIDADDQALIMDFGISRSATSGGATMTAHGAVVGTLEYMAPEQGRGVPVDHRADIYAFGLIVYDMIAGRHRLDAQESAIVEMMSRMQQPPEPLKTRVPQVAEALAAIVMRCLEPDADKRYATTAELVRALEGLDGEGRPLKPAAAQRPLWWRVGAISAGVVIVALIAAVLIVYRAGRGATEATPEAVSLLIAEFENRANDPVFEGSLEQALAIAMEGSPRVTVYPSKSAHAIAAQLAPASNGRVTQEVGQLISRREGIKVLLAGAIDRNGDGYRLTIKATDPANGREIASAARDVASKGDVLQAVAKLAERMRRELGESTSEMSRVAAAETFTAGSIDAMRAYARGQDLLNGGDYQKALAALQEALTYDPKMGRAYTVMAAIYVNLKQMDRADAAFQQAMKYLDRMSDREKYRTLALYNIAVAGNYDKAIESYEALIKAFPADNAAYGNLALAYLRTGNLVRAQEIARKGLDIYPNNILQRTNYAAYSLYAGDFDTGVKEAERVLKENPRYEFAYLPLALSHAERGDLNAAGAAYERLERVSETGRSLSILGRADLEIYQGNDSNALSILTPGLALDEKLQSTGELAIKYVVIGEVHLAAGRTGEAMASARKALGLSRDLNTLVGAARILIEGGEDQAPREIAIELDNRLQNQTAAYASAIRGEIAIRRGNLPEAIDHLRSALKRQDAWWIRYELGRAYFQAGNTHVTEAMQEFQACFDRRGEVADLFFADSPTMRYLPPLYYWLGRAREQVGAGKSAAQAYEEYVKTRGGTADDPLLADAHRRLAALR